MSYDRSNLHPYNRKLDLMVNDAINSGEWEKLIRYVEALIKNDKTSKFDKKDMRFFLRSILVAQYHLGKKLSSY